MRLYGFDEYLLGFNGDSIEFNVNYYRYYLLLIISDFMIINYRSF